MDPPSEVFLFHKPKGAVVTRRDERGRRTVYDLLPSWVLRDGWVPVGRLDMDSRGLLLFVRDGALVEAFARPGGLLKAYDVWVRGRVTSEHVRAALTGVPSPLGALACAACEVLGAAGPKTRLRVVLDEGKNRHIRRLFGALRDPLRGTPLKVLDLKRTAVGPLELDVPSGTWRWLEAGEVRSLLAVASGTPATARRRERDEGKVES